MDRCVDVLRELFLTPQELQSVTPILYEDAMSIWSGRSDSTLASGQNHDRGQT